MSTPPRNKVFARFAQDVASSPFGGAQASDSCELEYVQNQLIAHGFLSKPLQLSTWSSEETRRLERCLNAMLSKAADDQAHQTHLLSRYRTLANDYSRIEAQTSRDSQALVQSEHDRESAKAKALAASKELAAEVARHTLAKEEISKTRIAIQALKSSAQYESKRRESEMAAAITRLQRTGNQAPCVVLNAPERISRISSRQSNASEEVQLLEQSLKDLDEMRSAVQDENVQLREVIGDVANEVQATLEAIGMEMPSIHEEVAEPFINREKPHLSLSPDDLMTYLSKLFLRLRDAAVTAMEGTAQLQEKHDERFAQQTERVAELESSLAAMQADLDSARGEIAEVRTKLREAHARDEERIDKAASTAKEEAKDLRRQRKALEEERKKFTEASILLGKERVAFEKEKLAAVEEERFRITAHRQEHANDPLPEKATSKADLKHLPKLPERTAKPVIRSSSTSSALQSILAATADTPPARPLLAAITKAVQPAAVPSRPAAITALKPPSSAALAARNRVQRALQAAQARDVGKDL